MPSTAKVTHNNDEKTELTMECDEPSPNMDLYYRTADMLSPELIYAETPDGQEVAC